MKEFIFQDIPFFHNVEFKAKPGAPPFLVLLDGEGEEIERFDLSKKNRQECNDFLLGLGFYKKDSREGDVPEEYQTGPYVPVATEDGDDDDDAEETKKPDDEL